MTTSPIEYTVGDTAPVGIQVGQDLTGASSVQLQIHTDGTRLHLATDPLDVTVTDPTTGAGTFDPPDDLAAGRYTADVKIVNPTGERHSQRCTLYVRSHSDT